MSGFESFKALTKKLGSPQDGMRFIHVAGTNGKGSTCAFLESIMREAGFQRVGLYTSPHLEKENERIKVNGADISDEDFKRLESKVLAAWDESFELSYFAKITAMAFLYFKERGCGIVVLETGLGGRLDATNVISTPDCAVITRIGLDHTELLGETAELIAGEKAMIIKPGAPVVFAAQDASIEDVFKKRAEVLGVPWYRAEPLDGWKLGLCGDYQRENAANAKLAAELLGIPAEAITRGLQNAKWPGRFEEFAVPDSETRIILDGGHNPNCVEALVRSLQIDFPGKKFTFVFNAHENKDQAGMLNLVEPIAEHIIRVHNSIRETLDETIASAKNGSVICVFGTLYQVDEVRKYFTKNKEVFISGGRK